MMTNLPSRWQPNQRKEIHDKLHSTGSVQQMMLRKGCRSLARFIFESRFILPPNNITATTTPLSRIIYADMTIPITIACKQVYPFQQNSQFTCNLQVTVTSGSGIISKTSHPIKMNRTGTHTTNISTDILLDTPNTTLPGTIFVELVGASFQFENETWHATVASQILPILEVVQSNRLNDIISRIKLSPTSPLQSSLSLWRHVITSEFVNRPWYFFHRSQFPDSTAAIKLTNELCDNLTTSQKDIHHLLDTEEDVNTLTLKTFKERLESHRILDDLTAISQYVPQVRTTSTKQPICLKHTNGSSLHINYQAWQQLFKIADALNDALSQGAKSCQIIFTKHNSEGRFVNVEEILTETILLTRLNWRNNTKVATSIISFNCQEGIDYIIFNIHNVLSMVMLLQHWIDNIITSYTWMRNYDGICENNYIESTSKLVEIATLQDIEHVPPPPTFSSFPSWKDITTSPRQLHGPLLTIVFLLSKSSGNSLVQLIGNLYLQWSDWKQFGEFRVQLIAESQSYSSPLLSWLTEQYRNEPEFLSISYVPHGAARVYAAEHCSTRFITFCNTRFINKSDRWLCQLWPMVVDYEINVVSGKAILNDNEICHETLYELNVYRTSFLQKAENRQALQDTDDEALFIAAISTNSGRHIAHVCAVKAFHM